MQTTTNTPAQYFKALSILCYALTAGVVLFTIISAALMLSGTLHAARPGVKFIYSGGAAVIFAMGGFFAGNYLFDKRLLAVKDFKNLAEKLDGYRAAVILRYALLEGPGLFSIIAYFLTGQTKLLIVTGFIIFLMLNNLPAKEKTIKELELSFEDTNILNDPDGLIQ